MKIKWHTVMLNGYLFKERFYLSALPVGLGDMQRRVIKTSIITGRPAFKAYKWKRIFRIQNILAYASITASTAKATIPNLTLLLVRCVNVCISQGRPDNLRGPMQNICARPLVSKSPSNATIFPPPTYSSAKWPG